ncbi:uncharacterized protein LOC144442799 [Glandiceps talaboti]
MDLTTWKFLICVDFTLSVFFGVLVVICTPTIPPDSEYLDLINVALAGTASQSSTHYTAHASRSNDDNTQSHYELESCSHTQNDQDAWWKVDIGKSYAVYEIIVTNRQDCCSERLLNAEVKVGNSENIGENTRCGEMVGLDRVNEETLTFQCDGLVSGRYVSVQLVDRQDQLNICEVQVMVPKHIDIEMKQNATRELISELVALVPDNSTTVVSDEQLVEKMDNLYNITENLHGFDVNLEESKEMAQALVSVIDNVMESTLSNMKSSPDNDTLSPVNARDLTEKTMNILDKTADFVLTKMEPDNHPVLINTSSVMLHMESGSVEGVGNKTVDLGHNSGFAVPSAATLFPMLEANSSVYAKSYRITGNPFSGRGQEFIYDVLGLTFTFTNGTKITVTDTKEDIGVWLGRQSSRSYHGENVMVTVSDDWKNYTWSGQVSTLFAALQLTIVGPTPILANTTVKMYYENPHRNISEWIYTAAVTINGTAFDVFVPEHEIWYTGNYTFNFDLPAGIQTNFTVGMAQHRCDYWSDDEGRWRQDVCRVSPRSNNNATLCLCNRLT